MVNLMFIALIFVLSRLLHSHGYVTWIFVGVFVYLLAVEKIDEITANNSHSRSFSHYFTVMILTIFSALSGMRFLHSLVMGMSTLLSGFISAGVLGAVEIELLY